MTRMRIDDGDEGIADPNQIWARARTMTADLGLGATHRWERREPGHWRRRRETGEARGGDEERWRHGGSRAKNEDDGGGEEDEAIYI